MLSRATQDATQGEARPRCGAEGDETESAAVCPRGSSSGGRATKATRRQSTQGITQSRQSEPRRSQRRVSGHCVLTAGDDVFVACVEDC